MRGEYRIVWQGQPLVDDRVVIDGIVALAMVADIATHRPEPVKLLGWL
jgi:hypothetical protein